MWREVLGSLYDFNHAPANQVLVFGDGPVGLSFVNFLYLQGIEYIALIGRHEERQVLARELGATEVKRRKTQARVLSGKQ
jgi:threonine dehydrogenase-like Zn-dependent dehydrogenase